MKDKNENDSISLTKSAFVAYEQCAKQFWLAQHRPDLATPPDPTTRRRMQVGMEVELKARDWFPEGVTIPYRPQPEEMVSRTTQAITEGARALFQATFSVNDLLIKADILVRADMGWHLLEVKSSTEYKREKHLADVAFQVYVLRQAGLKVTKAGLFHLDNDCRFPDLSNLFTLTDITDEVEALLPHVQEAVIGMRQIGSRAEIPDVGIGRHCNKPQRCPYYDYCWRNVDGLTIYNIPYLKRPLERQLEAQGITYLLDIPEGTSLGHKTADAFVDLINQQRIEIDRAAIRTELAALSYPLYFFDFETIDYAIPKFVGCKPYQQVPFQYSCHILSADGTLTHRDYLHTTIGDPREELAKALLADIGETGNLIAYSIQFERGVLLHLADQFAAFKGKFTNMVDRLWDQLVIFRKYYRHHRFGNSNSLKSVLPVVVPELSYESLAVQDGLEAQVAWENMISCENEAEKQQLADQLLAYCHLDTLAMVKIHQTLVDL